MVLPVERSSAALSLATASGVSGLAEVIVAFMRPASASAISV
jgi:hypothetical protein